MTCLDDLNVTLQALVNALNGNLGGDAITISTEANAVANASAEAWALSSAQAAAMASAASVALVMLDIDISVSLSQTTTIVNETLPPVSPGVPPNITVFPEAQTGVSDAPRSPTPPASGSTCQAIYYVIDSLQALATVMSKFPQIGYVAANALAYVIIPAIQAAEFFLASKGIIIPKPVPVALQGAVLAMAAANLQVASILNDTAMWLATDRDDIAEMIYCLFFNGASTQVVAEALWDAAVTATGSVHVAQIVSILFSLNVLGSMLYDSAIYDASSVPASNCNFFTCGE